MKKIIISIFVLASVLVSMVLPAGAQFENDEWNILSDGSKVIYFNDGSSLTVSAPVIIATEYDQSRSIQTKTAQISTSVKDSNGEYEWLYTLTCVFSYEYGISSTCTNAYYNQTIYKGNWTFSNGATNISGNRGTGTGLYTEKFLFITIQSINVNLTLACDIYGNVTA